MALVLGLLGILLALGVPLFIEYSRRPILRIERSDDVNIHDTSAAWRLVHVRVVNEPLKGWRARWLLRNSASSCGLAVTFRSLSDGTEVAMRGRWSAAPEPISLLPFPPGLPVEYAKISPQAGVPTVRPTFDPTKVPQSTRLDLQADRAGELVPIAIKHDGDACAFGFTAESYADPAFRSDALRLRDTDYLVKVVAFAGGIEATKAFRLYNTGEQYTGLRLEPIDD